METRRDLLLLLNDLKADDLGDRSYPFTIKQLRYFSNPNRTKRRYTQFEIAKKSGGKRQITAPVRTLKSLLTYVNMILQAKYEPAPCVMGFVEGRSVADNARLHTGKHYVFNIDLKDFFPSVAQARVWKKLQCPPFNFRNEEHGRQRRVLADVIAGMCCMKVDDHTFVLPQGAPTSPVLTNIICERLDHRLTGLAHRFNLTYSRYADDITFSSMHNVYQPDGEFIKELHRIVEGQNFTINPAKTRLCRVSQRQEVTGLTVNVKTNVTRKYVADIRHILHTWKTKGYNAAFADFYPHYKAEKGHVKKGEPVMENVLDGKLDYLKMIKGGQDSTYLRLRNQFDQLMKQHKDGKARFSGSDFKYIRNYTLSEFYDLFKVRIPDDITEENGKKIITVDGRKTVVSVSSKIRLEDVESRPGDFLVSICQSKESRIFYLLHKKFTVEREKELETNYLDLTMDRLVKSDFSNLDILLDNGTK